jgi:DNA-binding response OmpR family regulator
MEGSAMKFCPNGVDHHRKAKLVNFLLINQGRLCTKDEIFDYMYGDDPDGGPEYGPHIVDVLVCRLRKKGWPIETEWGRGYIIRWQRPAPGETGARPFTLVKRPSLRRAMLDLLLSRRGHFVSREEINRSMPYLIANSADNHICHLRKAGWPIEHRKGLGWRLKFGRNGKAQKDGAHCSFLSGVISRAAA